MKTLTKSRSAFTLIEMLVVIAIIALLAAIIVPAVSRALDRAKSIKCLSNLRQIFLAHQMYMNDSQGEIVYCRSGEDYWYMKLEPYLEELAEPGELPTGVLRCPEESKLATGGTRGHYGKNQFLNAWPGANAGWNNWSLSRIPQPSQLLLFADATGRELSADRFKPRHRERANAVYLDGHVLSVDSDDIKKNHRDSTKPPWRPQL